MTFLSPQEPRIANVAEDTSPQLGGNLDVNNFNIIGAPVISGAGNDITLTPGAGVPTAGTQEVDVGGARVGGDSTGLTNDATVYTASVVVDGGGPQPIAVTGSAAQSYTTLLSELTADTTGAVWSLSGGNLLLTSSTTGASSTIAITDTDLFSTLTDYVAVNAAVAGLAGTDGAIEISQTGAPAVTTNKLYNIAGAITWNGTDLTAGISSVVEDTTPQLGGDLDVNGNSIIGAAGSGIGAGGTVAIAAGEGGSNGGGGTISIEAGAGGVISGDGGVVTIAGGVGTYGNGGNLTLTGGISGTGTAARTGGNVVITSGQSQTTDSTGNNSGNIDITAAGYSTVTNGTGFGGSIALEAGRSLYRTGGNVTLTGGYAYGENGGSIDLVGGVGEAVDGDYSGGDITLTAGNGTEVYGGSAYGGWVRIKAGNGPSGGGQITIVAGQNSGIGSQVGDIILQPGGNSNGSADGSIIIRNTNATTPGVPTLKFEELELNGGSFVGLRAPASLVGSFTLTLPIADSSGTQALVSNGAGTLAWATITPTATTAQLTAIGDAINTTPSKVAGYGVFNTTTNIPVWAVGATAGSVWVDATGATAHTPA